MQFWRRKLGRSGRVKWSRESTISCVPSTWTQINTSSARRRSSLRTQSRSVCCELFLILSLCLWFEHRSRWTWPESDCDNVLLVTTAYIFIILIVCYILKNLFVLTHLFGRHSYIYMYILKSLIFVTFYNRHCINRFLVLFLCSRCQSSIHPLPPIPFFTCDTGSLSLSISPKS